VTGHCHGRSKDGAVWEQLYADAWGCTGAVRNDTCGKFDFWSLIHQGRIFTVGGSGSYETFGKMYSDTWSTELV
jgi:hypothetical protein